MMRKIFGVKSISHLIYGLLMLAPILAIGVKCGYVMLNKNAYESYSDVSKVQLVNADNTNALSGNTLYMSYDTNQGSYTYSQQFMYSWISVDLNDYVAENLTYVPDGIRTYSSGAIQIHNPNNDVWTSTNGPNGQLIWGNTLTNFTINLKTTITNIFTGGNLRVQVMYQTQDKLDNVFYYAIDEIIQNNNFGKINFTGWFDNMMLDNNIQINQTYTHLFNWYLNYTLFISCAYILWLVLMWFVNFARKLLDRGMNYDW